MNNTDTHPRILSLSSTTSIPTRTTSPTTTSTPSTSATSTPFSTPQTRRASHESAHDAHHFIALQEEKTQHKLNASIKKMWREIKHHAAEHHRSVNAAYAASYGAGVTPVR